MGFSNYCGSDVHFSHVSHVPEKMFSKVWLLLIEYFDTHLRASPPPCLNVARIGGPKQERDALTFHVTDIPWSSLHCNNKQNIQMILNFHWTPVLAFFLTVLTPLDYIMCIFACFTCLYHDLTFGLFIRHQLVQQTHEHLSYPRVYVTKTSCVIFIVAFLSFLAAFR